MKKIILAALALLSTQTVHADLSVLFYNYFIEVKDNDVEQNFLPPGSVVQLIWNDTGALTGDVDMPVGYAVNASAVRGQSDGAGGYVLARRETFSSGMWDQEDETPMYATSEFVGMININTGYFFARVFENIGTIGEYFKDVPMGLGANYIYSSTDTTKTWSENAIPGNYGDVMYIGATTYVIPEPGTIGFMGIGLVCLRFLRMRKIARG